MTSGCGVRLRPFTEALKTLQIPHPDEAKLGSVLTNKDDTRITRPVFGELHAGVKSPGDCSGIITRVDAAEAAGSKINKEVNTGVLSSPTEC